MVRTAKMQAWWDSISDLQKCG